MPQHFLKGCFRTPVLLLSESFYFWLYLFLANLYLINFLLTLSFILNKPYSSQFHFLSSNRAVLQRPLAAFLLLKLNNPIFFSFLSAALHYFFFCFAHFNSLFLNINDKKCTVFYSTLPSPSPLIFPISTCPTLLVLHLLFSQAHYTSRLYLVTIIDLPSITMRTICFSDLQQILANST